MATTARETVPVWQLAMLVLSVLVIGMMTVTTFVPLEPESALLVDTFDNMICVVFIADFFGRLAKATDRWRFVKRNWIDIVSSIPAIEAFRIGRFVRVVRLLRVLRALRSIKYVFAFVFMNRAKGAFASVALASFVAWFFSALAILSLESTENSTIRTAEDALWWSITTLTTVGYGDLYPVTTEGRFVATVLMIFGVGFFGTLTAYVASNFVGADTGAKDEIAALRDEIAELRRAIIHPPVGRDDHPTSRHNQPINRADASDA